MLQADRQENTGTQQTLLQQATMMPHGRQGTSQEIQRFYYHSRQILKENQANLRKRKKTRFRQILKKL
jgi:hypothetical protein